MSQKDNCIRCNGKGFVEFYDAHKRQFRQVPCSFCTPDPLAEALASKALNIPVKIEEKTSLEIYALPVDQEELRLIKLALFEISEYLGSPKLVNLRQRVNIMMSNASVKLAVDSIFNSDEFKKAAPVFYNGELVEVSLVKEPV